MQFLGPAEKGIKENNLTSLSLENRIGSNLKGSLKSFSSRPKRNGEIFKTVLGGKVNPSIVSGSATDLDIEGT